MNLSVHTFCSGFSSLWDLEERDRVRVRTVQRVHQLDEFSIQLQ